MTPAIQDTDVRFNTFQLRAVMTLYFHTERW